MLRITIEIVPQGDESRARTIATGIIVNTGAGTPNRGNYRVDLRTEGARKWKQTEVRGFPRKYLLAWDLLYRALDQLVGDRNHADQRRPVVVNQRSQPHES